MDERTLNHLKSQHENLVFDLPLNLKEGRFISPGMMLNISDEKAKLILIDLGLEPKLSDKKNIQNVLRVFLGNAESELKSLLDFKSINWLFVHGKSNSYSIIPNKPKWYNHKPVRVVFDLLIKNGLSLNYYKTYKINHRNLSGLGSYFLFTTKMFDLVKDYSVGYDLLIKDETMKDVKDQLVRVKKEYVGLVVTLFSSFNGLSFNLIKKEDIRDSIKKDIREETKERNLIKQDSNILQKSYPVELKGDSSFLNPYRYFAETNKDKLWVTFLNPPSWLEQFPENHPIFALGNFSKCSVEIREIVLLSALKAKTEEECYESIQEEMKNHPLIPLGNFSKDMFYQILLQYSELPFFDPENIWIDYVNYNFNESISEKLQGKGIDFIKQENTFEVDRIHESVLESIMIEVFQEQTKSKNTPAIKSTNTIKIVSSPSKPQEEPKRICVAPSPRESIVEAPSSLRRPTEYDSLMSMFDDELEMESV